jgi:outer membrane protein assembly factor BamB
LQALGFWNKIAHSVGTSVHYYSGILMPLILAIFLIFAATSLSQAKVVEQISKLVPISPISGGDFGVSVAIDDGVAIVGATNASGFPSSRTGAAYLIDAATGTALVTLTPTTPVIEAGFGRAVALNNGVAVVSADYPGTGRESAYLFDASTGSELARLTADDPNAGTGFGASVSIKEAVVVIGAPDERTPILGGSAYVFDAATGAKLRKLTPDGPAQSTGRFGTAVAIDSGRALVGAPANSDGGHAAFLFEIGTGEQLVKLTTPDLARDSRFGASVALSHGLALVGAPSTFGAAYLFDTNTGAQLAKLVPDETIGRDNFGSSVALGNGFALVGASVDYTDGGYGATYLFDTSTGAQLAKFRGDDVVFASRFGASAAVDGDMAIIGAFQTTVGTARNGAAYVFRISVPEPHALLLALVAITSLAHQRR